MTLQLLPPADADETGNEPESADSDLGPMVPQQFAAGAPLSPGPLPEELRAHLPRAEALVWWDEHLEVQWYPVFWTFCGSLLILGIGSVIAPEFWLRGIDEIFPPLAAVLSPVAAVGMRAWFSRCSLMLTDAAWVHLDRHGRVTRLPHRSLRRIAKDSIFGGVLLEGPPGLVRVPSPLTQNAQRALASQARMNPFSSGDKRPLDTVGWLPPVQLG